MSSRKPLFATSFAKELVEKMLKLESISKELKNKFGDDFIGFTIFGSLEKGYSSKGSDLDWGIIAKNRRVSDYFKKLAGSLNLCHEYYLGVDKDYKISERPDFLFYGLFFGDFKELVKLQKSILLTFSDSGWDEIRNNILNLETGLYKAGTRFDIPDEELEKIEQFVALLKTPPPRQEALEIIKRRAEYLKI